MISLILASFLITSDLGGVRDINHLGQVLLPDGQWRSICEDGPPDAGSICWVVWNKYFIIEAYWDPCLNAWISASGEVISRSDQIEYYRYPEFI